MRATPTSFGYAVRPDRAKGEQCTALVIREHSGVLHCLRCGVDANHADRCGHIAAAKRQTQPE